MSWFAFVNLNKEATYLLTYLLTCTCSWLSSAKACSLTPNFEARSARSAVGLYKILYTVVICRPYQRLYTTVDFTKNTQLYLIPRSANYS